MTFLSRYATITPIDPLAIIKQADSFEPLKERINNQIRAAELRVISSTGENLGVFPTKEALEMAHQENLDLIEIAPLAVPPIAKIMEFGKYQYEQAKKFKKAKANAKVTETKSIQIKIGTGDHDLELKAKTASNWLKEGHRIKVELFLAGRAKYMKEDFLKERLDRVLKLITENFKIAEPYKKIPKGAMVALERDSKKQE